MAAQAPNGRQIRDTLACDSANLAAIDRVDQSAWSALYRVVKHCPPPPVPVVDSNGAGDAFISGFLSGRLAGADLETCMEHGLRAGAFVCTIQGTGEKFATEADLGLGKVTAWPITISTSRTTAIPSLGTYGTPGASISG